MNIDYFNPLYENAPKIGTIAFLVGFYDLNSTRYKLRNKPPKTNVSLEYRVYGWCGTDNNVSIHGDGIIKIVRTYKNGRIKLQRLTKPPYGNNDFCISKPEYKEEIEKFLEENGFEDSFTYIINEG